MLQYIINLYKLLITKEHEYVTYTPTYQMHISNGKGRTNCNIKMNIAQWEVDDLSDAYDGNIYVCELCVQAIHPTILKIYIDIEGVIKK